jgi:2-amino-4-hydroxy-6-hydroxymethyldihydropteridine diphosphokinase
VIIEIAPWLAVFGFGGNIGTEAEIQERFVRAREALGQYGHVWSAPLYRSAPVGPAQQDFLNTAVQVRIDDGQPDELVAIVREIELLLGRDRRAEERWGPRKIDIDVLVWGSRVVRTPHIELPHPRLVERRFALEPLFELLAPYTLPGTQESIASHLWRVRDQRVEKIATSW